jgi:hypothetical protein
MNQPNVQRAWLPVAVALAVGSVGCSVNTNPQAPSWDTAVNVPLVNQVHTMQDLVGSEAVVITSAEAGILGFRVEGDTITTTVGDHLSLAGFTGSFHDSLGEFDVRDPGVEQSSYKFATLWPPSVGLDGSTAPVPSFTFTDQATNLPDFASFTAVTLSAGTLTVTITNNFPVPLDVSAVDVVERGTGALVTSLSFPSSIPAGGSDSQSVDLAGASFSNQLGVRVTGGSAGSGSPVFIDKDAAIAVDAGFSGLHASAATAEIPATSFNYVEDLALPDDMTVTTATLASGSLTLDLDSAIPLGSQVTITIPELTLPGGGPLVVVTSLTAGGQSSRVIDLTGCSLAPGAPDLAGVQSLDVQVDAQTVDTGGASVAVSAGDQVNLDASVSDLVLDHVQGVLSATTFDVPADTTTVDLPEGLESIGLVQASLDLVITTAIQFPFQLDLVAHGRGNSGATCDLPIQGEFPAGPGAGLRELHLVLDETNSDIVPFLNSLPAEIAFGGEVTLGDGAAASSVDRDDAFTARFVMSTPLRLTLEEQTIEPDPSNLVVIEGTDGAGGSGDETTLSPDVTRRLLQGSVRVQVANHLPFGMQMRVKLATDSTRVHSAPDVVVGPFTVAAGAINAATGLVDASVTSVSDLGLTPADLELFKNPSGPAKRIWGGVELVVAGTGGEAVAVRPSDFVEISALAHLEVNVDLAKND